jgi:hypothetical protein
MMLRMAWALTAAEERALIAARDHDPKAYGREQAAALLKVHGGGLLQSCHRSCCAACSVHETFS